MRRHPSNRLGMALVLAMIAGMVLMGMFTSSAIATIGDSPYNASDGVLDGHSSISCQIDPITGTPDTTTFTQGAKEDTIGPTVGSDSIPPNKSDFTKGCIGFATGTSSNDIWAYAYAQRTNSLGSAFFDVEYNQSSAVDANGLPVRTAGDLLLVFSFPGGQKAPSVQAAFWVTSGNPKQVCEQNPTVPCWGPLSGNLLQQGVAESTVNADLLRWDAAVNLTDAGVIPSNQCNPFSSAYIKGTSSGFGSEMKDFVSPISANQVFCGDINVHKVDDASPPNALQGAIFTLYNDVNGNGAFDMATDTSTGETCTTNANGNCSFEDVLFGKYCVVETQGVANHDLAPPQCGTLSSSNLTLSFTFVNPRQLGAILVTKTGKDKACTGAGVPDASCVSAGVRKLAGATFTIDGANAKTTGATGTVCWDGLFVGSSHTINETSAPAGYQIDDTDPATPGLQTSKTVAVSVQGTCQTAVNPVTFTDTPLSNITVSFDAQVNGATTATIQCTGDASATDLPEGSPRTLSDLEPGTYTCTVVIDP